MSPFVTTKVVDGTPVQAASVNPTFVEIENEINALDDAVEDIIDGTTPVPNSPIVEADVPNLPASKITSGQLAIAQGGTGQATASAAFDALSPMTTAGDLIVGAASGAAVRLAAGATDAVRYLSRNTSGVFQWVEGAPSVGGGLTTDTVKFVIKTDTQVSSGITGGNAVAVSGLTISHAVSKVGNKVLVIGQVSGSFAASIDIPLVAAAPTVDGTAFAIGDAAGVRTRVQSQSRGASVNDNMTSVSIVGEYTPASTASMTYGINVYNSAASAASTIYVNRTVDDSNVVSRARGASVLCLIEIEDVS